MPNGLAATFGTNFRFKLNRAAFREQVLKGRGVTDACVMAAHHAADTDPRVRVLRQTTAKTRRGAVMLCNAEDETDDGALTAALGRVRV